MAPCSAGGRMLVSSMRSSRLPAPSTTWKRGPRSSSRGRHAHPDYRATARRGAMAGARWCRCRSTAASSAPTSSGSARRSPGVPAVRGHDGRPCRHPGAARALAFNLTNFLGSRRSGRPSRGGSACACPRGTRLVMGNALVGRPAEPAPARRADPLRRPRSRARAQGGRNRSGAVVCPAGRRGIRARRRRGARAGGLGRNVRAAPQADVQVPVTDYPGSRTPTPAKASTAALQSGAGHGRRGRKRRTLDAGARSHGRKAAPTGLFPTYRARSREARPHRGQCGRQDASSTRRDSYHDFVERDVRGGAHHPERARLISICDAERSCTDYGLGLVHPRTRNLSGATSRTAMLIAEACASSRARVGSDARGVEASVEPSTTVGRDNGGGRSFGRGKAVLDRFNGDPANKRNPCLRPDRPRPRSARVAVWPGDLGYERGLDADRNGQSARSGSGQADSRLNHAVRQRHGFDLPRTYPGPGITLGPALVSGWLIGTHAADPAPR